VYVQEQGLPEGHRSSGKGVSFFNDLSAPVWYNDLT